MYGFNDILGQEQIKDHLTGALNENKISHAYIFSGEEGSGKKMLAERFAAALECTDDTVRPCGSCLSCMQAESGNHPDIVYVTHEKKIISVDDIRNQLVNDVAIRPYSGQYKVYIVDDAEKMNEAAQNALLKTLEEPPEYAVIILLASNTGAFLQTILSRCVVLQLKPVETDLIKAYLMDKKQLPDYVAKLCASFSCGCIGRALRYASDEQFTAIRDEVLHLVKYIDDMSVAEVTDFLNGIGESPEKKAAIDDYFDLISLWYRDVLMYKATRDVNRIVFSEDINTIRQQASIRTFENLNNIVLSIERCRKRLAANVYFDVAVELLLLALKAK